MNKRIKKKKLARLLDKSTIYKHGRTKDMYKWCKLYNTHILRMGVYMDYLFVIGENNKCPVVYVSCPNFLISKYNEEGFGELDKKVHGGITFGSGEVYDKAYLFVQDSTNGLQLRSYLISTGANKQLIIGGNSINELEHKNDRDILCLSKLVFDNDEEKWFSSTGILGWDYGHLNDYLTPPPHGYPAQQSSQCIRYSILDIFEDVVRAIDHLIKDEVLFTIDYLIDNMVNEN